MRRRRDDLSAGDIVLLWAGSYAAVARCVATARPWSPRRAAALALTVPALVAYLTVQWLFLALDELLYRGYRHVEVRQPLFVVGMPRSGTSFLQATLAEDGDRFTTLRLRELVLAPSVTQRRLLRRMARVDRALGRPLGRSAGWLQARLADRMGGVHPVDVDGPGEDFLLLLPAMACFLLVVVFPTSPAIWELTAIDDWPAPRRHRLMRLYRAGLQRHLYATRLRWQDARPDRRILSKNPSFTACLGTLAETFPDARFVCCFRDPARALPSQLSSLRPAAGALGYDPGLAPIRDRFVEMYERFAGQAAQSLGPLAEEGRAAFVPLERLGADVAGSVERVYATLGWTPSGEFRAALDRRTLQSRGYRSGHSYDAAALGLDVGQIESRFRPLMRRLNDLASPEIHA